MENDSSNESIQPKKSSCRVIFLLIILIILIIGAVIYWWWQSKNNQQQASTSSNSTSSTSENATAAEDNWTRDATFIIKSTTSTSTLKLADGTLRIYLMSSGKIVYQDSTNGKSFGDTQPTGISEDQDKMISNPAVLKIKNGDWIMIYEQAPPKQPGEKEGMPGPATQRNLYAATSTDSKNFTKVGIAIDSSKDDNYFASVPDLVLLPDGEIRMYYVCGGEAICSTLSADSGKTWTKDSGKRLENQAVDPDVLIATENGETKYLMYYSVLSQTTNQIYKSISSDGLTWQEGVGVLKPSSSSMTVIDPDVVKFSDNKYLMYYGEASSSGTAGGGINLYLAELSGEIF